MPKVTMIPATINPLTHLPSVAARKRRVAGYARVSTDSDEQFTSYEAQVDYYTKFIQSKPEWDFVKVYTDDPVVLTKDCCLDINGHTVNDNGVAVAIVSNYGLNALLGRAIGYDAVREGNRLVTRAQINPLRGSGAIIKHIQHTQPVL